MTIDHPFCREACRKPSSSAQSTVSAMPTARQAVTPLSTAVALAACKAQTGGAMDPSPSALSVAAIVASAFGKLDLKRRAPLLGRLLGAVGPLALAVVSGGVFVKYLPNARWSVVPVSFEDAALATSRQVYELVRYVEQSNPNLIEGVLTALQQDGVTMTALGASIVAIAIKQIPGRSRQVSTSSAKA